MNHTGVGTPHQCASPNRPKELGTPRTPNPFVILRAIPRKIVSVHKVMMMGDILTRQTIRPLMNPKSMPSRMPAIHATADGRDLAIMADATEHSAYCDPIERSTLPPTIR